MATLAEEIKTFKEAGFSSEEITEWKKDQVKTLSEAGFTTQEIAKDLGHKEINLTPIRKFWSNIINLGKEENEKAYTEIQQLNAQNDDTPFIQKQKEKLVGDIFEPGKYWKRGWDGGIWDLHQSYVNDEPMPEIYTTDNPKDTGFLERNIMNVSRLAKDLPVYAAAAVPFGLASRNKDVTLAGSAFVEGSLRQTYL